MTELMVHNIVSVAVDEQYFAPAGKDDAFYVTNIRATDNKGQEVTFKLFSAKPLEVAKQ